MRSRGLRGEEPHHPCRALATNLPQGSWAACPLLGGTLSKCPAKRQRAGRVLQHGRLSYHRPATTTRLALCYRHLPKHCEPVCLFPSVSPLGTPPFPIPPEPLPALGLAGSSDSTSHPPWDMLFNLSFSLSSEKLHPAQTLVLGSLTNAHEGSRVCQSPRETQQTGGNHRILPCGLNTITRIQRLGKACRHK